MLRRDAGKRASSRERRGKGQAIGGRGKEQAIPSPGTGAQRGQREKAWVKIQKEQKVKRSKVTFDKSEKVKVKR